MTNLNRLEQLLSYYQADPKDAFTIYGLALEYLNSDLVKARSYFEILLQEHPNYLPTYYHVGHLYEDLEEEELAIAAYKKGIKLAEAEKKTMTLRELKNALAELEF